MTGALVFASTACHADETDRSAAATLSSVPSAFSQAGSDRSAIVPAVATATLQTQPADSQKSPQSFLSGVATTASDVVTSALNMIGVRYRWGGDTPSAGLDCSGFVRYVFQDTLGLTLPRRAEEMSRVGERISAAKLQPGDLVFFSTVRRRLSHVGIYIGDNKFVHAPSTGSNIRVDEMDNGYWEKRFISARRVDVSYSPDSDEAVRLMRAAATATR
ncbi:MAG: C40 family peptidase [Janthinobacterium lividum]